MQRHRGAVGEPPRRVEIPTWRQNRSSPPRRGRAAVPGERKSFPKQVTDLHPCSARAIERGVVEPYTGDLAESLGTFSPTRILPVFQTWV